MDRSSSASSPTTPRFESHLATQAQVMIDAGQRIARSTATIHRANETGARHFVILRDAQGNESVQYLTDRDPAPLHADGTVKLHDAASFIKYLKRQAAKNERTSIYANMRAAQPEFVAVLDDHAGRDTPGWRQWRAEYAIEFSPEWKAWTAQNGEGKAFAGTTAFAKFIEDNAPDITEPPAAVMQEIALNFRINTEVQFASAQRLQDGHVELIYNHLVDGHSRGAGGNKIGIPERFRIQVPVWAGLSAKLYEIEARFRYRLRDGKLTLWYELVRPHKVLDAAFRDTWQEIQQALDTTILLGTPE